MLEDLFASQGYDSAVLYIGLCKVFSVQCIVYSVKGKLYIVKYTV